MFDFPLKRVAISDAPVAKDWYTIGLPSGRFTPTFYAPEMVASAIRAGKLSGV